MRKTEFKAVPLGVNGGIDESNLSAYMLAPAAGNNYICLDAGTLTFGIKKAIEKGAFAVPAGEVLKTYIKGYLISHAHLDHVSGLIINSPEDTAKPVYGMPGVLKILKEKYFTWDSWANFANEGEAPALKKYTYTYLAEDSEITLAGTGMTLRSFPLSHSNTSASTAFLLKNNNSYALYLGDTGADVIEGSDKLHKLWQAITPLVKSGQLRAIFIEVSFPDEQPENALFGHLTPRLFMKEMDQLDKMSGKHTLKEVSLIITHMKPSGNNEQIIRRQLLEKNSLQLKLVFPEQGKIIQF